jgi:hypothetical protein
MATTRSVTGTRAVDDVAGFSRPNAPRPSLRSQRATALVACRAYPCPWWAEALTQARPAPAAAVGLVQGQPQRETVEQLRGGDPDPGCQELSGITQGRVERCGVEPALAVEVHEQPRSGTKWPDRLGFGHLAAQRHEPARRDRHAGQMVTRLLEGHRPLHAAQRQWH